MFHPYPGLKQCHLKLHVSCGLRGYNSPGFVQGTFKNEALENEDRSMKHPNLENEDP